VSIFTHVVTLRFRGVVTGQDDYGNDVYGPDRDESWPAWWEPRTSGENTTAQEQVTSGYWLYLQLAAPLTAADAVVIDGREYQVVGEPGRQPGGFAIDGYQKAALERVTG
jgi:hypothetical protein